MHIQIINESLQKARLIINESLRKEKKSEDKKQMVFYYQNCSSDREKLLRSLEQFIQNSERSEQFLETECFFNLFVEVSHI